VEVGENEQGSFEGRALMLEIAGGILLAVVILIFVLANFGWVVVGLSALAMAGLAAGGVIVLVALPADYRNEILAMLLVALGFAAVGAFGYWTHVDKRFLLPDDKPGQDKAK
jgi:hypothetical protein